MGKTKKIARKLGSLPIKAYQKIISPLLGPSCRYYPSCSSYGIEAIETFGFFKGFYLLIKRLLKCHPFSLGGFDPVPGRHHHGDKK